MARYLFSHCGSPPLITPDLPDVQAVEHWAGKCFGYSTDWVWMDIGPDNHDLIVLLVDLCGSGDLDLDWPVRRTLGDEDWFIGPIEVL